MDSIEIRHGGIGSACGRPVRSGGFLLIGCVVVLEGTSFSLGHGLEDHVANGGPLSLRQALQLGCDAAWVRARIPRLFGFTPDFAELDKSILYEGFVAVVMDEGVGYPFVFTDYYASSRLIFSDEGPGPEVKDQIARAFWDALLENPDDLDDFEYRVSHFDGPGTLVIGCDAGRIYCDQEVEG